ncbi:hypothetical protein TUM4445_19730 [Shewanella sp. MBTL60-112-B2]|nr:hypothetical protein TUM4444_16130 [Shewanella sp. MBTL60-112-B1]GIU33120.1 hypothetical protein TUM4445_19730 [Shewanella sp. MBTL60-112-B2]
MIGANALIEQPMGNNRLAELYGIVYKFKTTNPNSIAKKGAITSAFK